MKCHENSGSGYLRVFWRGKYKCWLPKISGNGNILQNKKCANGILRGVYREVGKFGKKQWAFLVVYMCII